MKRLHIVLIFLLLASSVSASEEIYQFSIKNLQQEPYLGNPPGWDYLWHPQRYIAVTSVPAPQSNKELRAVNVTITEYVVYFAGLMNFAPVPGTTKFFNIYEDTQLYLPDFPNEIDYKGNTFGRITLASSPYGNSVSPPRQFTRHLNIFVYDNLNISGDLEIQITGTSIHQIRSNLPLYVFKMFWKSNIRGTVTYSYK